MIGWGVQGATWMFMGKNSLVKSNESVLILAVKDRRNFECDSWMPVSIQKADTMSAFRWIAVDESVEDSMSST